ESAPEPRPRSPRECPSPRWAKVPHPAARIRPTPTQRKPSLSVEPSLVDVSFGQLEAFGHLPGRVLGPHTGIDQGADFAAVVLRCGRDLSGAREPQRQHPALSCSGRLPQRADGPAPGLPADLRVLAADAQRTLRADHLPEAVPGVRD